MISGEPLPVEKAAGSRVTGATLNTTGALVRLAERVGAETLLAQIVRAVSEAQRSRAPIQRLADVFFFQAEDGIRDPLVTGVQTCALPISLDPAVWPTPAVTYSERRA